MRTRAAYPPHTLDCPELLQLFIVCVVVYFCEHGSHFSFFTTRHDTTPGQRKGRQCYSVRILRLIITHSCFSHYNSPRNSQESRTNDLGMKDIFVSSSTQYSMQQVDDQLSSLKSALVAECHPNNQLECMQDKHDASSVADILPLPVLEQEDNQSTSAQVPTRPQKMKSASQKRRALHKGSLLEGSMSDAEEYGINAEDDISEDRIIVSKRFNGSKDITKLRLKEQEYTGSNALEMVPSANNLSEEVFAAEKNFQSRNQHRQSGHHVDCLSRRRNTHKEPFVKNENLSSCLHRTSQRSAFFPINRVDVTQKGSNSAKCIFAADNTNENTPQHSSQILSNTMSVTKANACTKIHSDKYYYNTRTHEHSAPDSGLNITQQQQWGRSTSNTTNLGQTLMSNCIQSNGSIHIISERCQDNTNFISSLASVEERRQKRMPHRQDLPGLATTPIPFSFSTSAHPKAMEIQYQNCNHQPLQSSICSSNVSTMWRYVYPNEYDCKTASANNYDAMYNSWMIGHFISTTIPLDQRPSFLPVHCQYSRIQSPSKMPETMGVIPPDKNSMCDVIASTHTTNETAKAANRATMHNYPCDGNDCWKCSISASQPESVEVGIKAERSLCHNHTANTITKCQQICRSSTVKVDRAGKTVIFDSCNNFNEHDTKIRDKNNASSPANRKLESENLTITSTCHEFDLPQEIETRNKNIQRKPLTITLSSKHKQNKCPDFHMPQSSQRIQAAAADDPLRLLALTSQLLDDEGSGIDCLNSLIYTHGDVGVHDKTKSTCDDKLHRFQDNTSPKLCEPIQEYRSRHVCNICQKAFSCSSNLHRHRRVHTGTKPYACMYCGLCFSNSSNRRKHERCHCKKRPIGSVKPVSEQNNPFTSLPALNP
eukprot:gene2492-5422_t